MLLRCGVGGPLRNIARHSKAEVTGITINDYQVKKANGYIAKDKLASTCKVVQGIRLKAHRNAFLWLRMLPCLKADE